MAQSESGDSGFLYLGVFNTGAAEFIKYEIGCLRRRLDVYYMEAKERAHDDLCLVIIAANVINDLSRRFTVHIYSVCTTTGRRHSIIVLSDFYFNEFDLFRGNYQYPGCGI